MDENKAAIFRLFEQGAFPADASHIKKVLQGRKIIVYGAGECCHWFVEVAMNIHGFMPVAVLDRTFHAGDTYEGIPGFSPLEYKPTEEEQREGIAVVCVAKREYHGEILRSLEDLGFQNIIFLRDIYEIHNPFNLPGELETQGFDFYRAQKDRIVACLDLFADDESREIYTRCLRTHLSRKPVPLPSRARAEQFFPKDIELRRGYSRFVCCGFDMEIMRILNETSGKVDEIACFEPDPTLFAPLSEYLWKRKDELACNTIAMPCAAYSREAVMPFTSANRGHIRRVPTGFGSRLLEGGEITVQCVTLDHTLPGFSPTFICMDVEGAEPEALKGAEGLIRAHRPDLAVCVYHSPAHLWEIPFYLHGLGVGYRFFLRNYTTFTSETVLYATT